MAPSESESHLAPRTVSWMEPASASRAPACPGPLTRSVGRDRCCAHRKPPGQRVRVLRVWLGLPSPRRGEPDARLGTLDPPERSPSPVYGAGLLNRLGWIAPR